MNVQVAPGAPDIIPAVLASVVGVFFAVVAVVGLFVIVVVANRADPDPTGRRPLAVYYFAVSFFSLFVTLFGSFGIVLGLVQLIGGHRSSLPPGFTSGAVHPVGDAVARVAVLSAIITLVALAVLLVHLRQGLDVSGHADPRLGPLGRVAQSYVAGTAFVSVLVMAGSLVVALYEVVRIIAPGVFEVTGTRVDTLRTVIAAVYLAAAALVVLVTHLRFVPAEVRRLSWSIVRPGHRPAPDPGHGGPPPAGPPPSGVTATPPPAGPPVMPGPSAP